MRNSSRKVNLGGRGRQRFLDSFAIPFQGILLTAPTGRFLGFIVIRNVAFLYISANQVVWLLRECLAVLFILSNSDLQNYKASGIAEPRDEESSV